MIEISSKESMYILEGGPDVEQVSFVLDKVPPDFYTYGQVSVSDDLKIADRLKLIKKADKLIEELKVS